MTLAQKSFLHFAQITRKLPNFRGKVRFLLSAYKRLGLSPEHHYVTTVLGKPIPYRVTLDLCCHHERMAYFMDDYEPRFVSFLSRLFDGNGSFVDIGANIGLISIPFTLMNRGKASLCAPSSQKLTYCIEALDTNYSSLSNNVRMNQLDQDISCICSAVGEKEKTVEIQMEQNLKKGAGTGTANIIPENGGWKCEKFSLDVTTVDLLIERKLLPQNCSLIKIDTDGYDLFVLMGAKNYLGNARPVIFGEFMSKCLGWHGHAINDVEMYLKSFHYSLFGKKSETKFIPLRNIKQFTFDAIAIPDEKLAQYEWCLGN